MQQEQFIDEREPQRALRLVDLDHAGWAWEWLRRNPRYRADVALTDRSVARSDRVISLDPNAAQRALPWGLHFR